MSRAIELETGVFGVPTLGELIRVLSNLPHSAFEKEVNFDFCGFEPKSLSSYRGYYDHLAIIPTSDWNRMKLSEFLKMLENAVGKIYEGYKGGEYKMTLETPVWVSPYGGCGSTAIVSIYEEDSYVILNTSRVDS